MKKMLISLIVLTIFGFAFHCKADTINGVKVVSNDGQTITLEDGTKAFNDGGIWYEKGGFYNIKVKLITETSPVSQEINQPTVSPQGVVNNTDASQFKTSELEAQAKTAQDGLKSQSNELKAATYNQNASHFKTSELEVQAKTAQKKGTMARFGKTHSNRTRNSTTNSGTARIQIPQSLRLKMAKNKPLRTKNILTNTSKREGAKGVKSFLKTLPLAGENAPLSSFFLLTGLALLSGIGIVFCLYKKHECHSK